ncbi:MAG: L,D-transpeptidase [Acidimicrobiales bacterium]
MPAASRRLPALAAAAAALVGVGALAGCSGERPTLGAVPPSVPKDATTAATTTTQQVPEDDGILTPDELKGWIVTPKGTPEVYAKPDTSAKRLAIPASTEAGAPTTFAAIGDAGSGPAQEFTGWYQVALPSRPNGSTGWVPAASAKVTKTPFAVLVSLQDRTIRVTKDGAQVFEAPIAIGTEENPTPQNGTFVTELIDNNAPQGSYGPYAFGLALHSDTLSEFNGSDGQVGIHGTNRPDLIGDRVSHGCVRLKNGDIEQMVALGLPLGVPVFIS